MNVQKYEVIYYLIRSLIRELLDPYFSNNFDAASKDLKWHKASSYQKLINQISKLYP